MKNFFSVVISLLLVLSLLLAGCSQSQLSEEDSVELSDNFGQYDDGQHINGTDAYEVEVPFGDSISSFTFDENGKLLSQSNPGTNTDVELISYSYDSKGNCISVSRYNENQAVIAEKIFSYDALGNCIEESVYEFDGDERIFDYGYSYERDADGNIIKITEDSGFAEVYSYDEKGRCVREVSYNPGSAVLSELNFYYDDSNRLVEVASSKSNVKYEYDAQGRLIKEEHMDGYCIEYEYEPDGKVNVYNIAQDGNQKKLSHTKEYYDNGKVIKLTWYSDGDESAVEEINIALFEELIANEPDPMVLKNY